MDIITKNLTQNYFNITARTSVRDFWLTFGAIMVLAVAIFLISHLGIPNSITAFLIVAIFIPSQTLALRRFNDIGLSGNDYAIFICSIFVCALAAYFCHVSDYVFAMAVALWFLVGCFVAFVIQFLRSSL